MPTFTELPGDIVGAPPYSARGCLMQGMFLPGDLAAQQRFCDLALNGPAAGALVFRAVTPLVLMTALYAQTMTSTNPGDAPKGVMQEWDVGFWTAVRGGVPGKENDWKSYWLPSFLFVDSSPAMASGREIFGYPKNTARPSSERARSRNDHGIRRWCSSSSSTSPVFRPREAAGRRAPGERGARRSGGRGDGTGGEPRGGLGDLQRRVSDEGRGSHALRFPHAALARASSAMPQVLLQQGATRHGVRARRRCSPSSASRRGPSASPAAACCTRRRSSPSPPPPATRSWKPWAWRPPRSANSASGSSRSSRWAGPPPALTDLGWAIGIRFPGL